MKIIQWQNSDIENHGMSELINNVYGNIEIKNPRYIDWQYNKNPQGKSIIVLCVDEEKGDHVIAQEPIISSILNLDKTDVKASLSLNSIVHLQYRRRGIFSKLVKTLPDLALKENIVVVYGVPNPNSHKAFLKEGWKEITKLPLLVRILKPSKYYNNVLKVFLRPIDFFFKIKNVEQFEEYEGDFNEFNDLSTKLSERIKVFQNRNSQYLKWRYKDHPTRKYSTYVIRKESKIIGYLITRTTNFNGKSIGVILDFVTDGKDVKDYENLVKFSLMKLREKEIAIAIATIPPHTLEYRILKKIGFFKVPERMKPEPLPLIVNIFDKKNQDLKSLNKYENWFFTFGDYDVF